MRRSSEFVFRTRQTGSAEWEHRHRDVVDHAKRHLDNLCPEDYYYWFIGTYIHRGPWAYDARALWLCDPLLSQSLRRQALVGEAKVRWGRGGVAPRDGSGGPR